LTPPICGLANDTSNHVPDATAWANFVPPAVGGTYTDALYGCPVKRLTDATVGGVGGLHHYYSTIEPMSAGDTKIWVFPENGGDYIIDLNGNVVVSAANMPGKNGNEIFWDRTDDTVFWQTSSNTLEKCTVNSSAGTVSCVTNHTFSEYSGHGVNSPDESSMTPNGWLYLVGQNTVGGAIDIFMFNPSTGTKSPVHTTTCTGDIMTPSPGCIHKLIATADGGVIAHLTGSAPESGAFLWGPESSTAWTWTQIMSNVPHYDAGKDLLGNPMVAEEQDAQTSGSGCSAGYSAAYRAFLTGNVTCLFNTSPPQPTGWHISARDWPTSGWLVYSPQNDGSSGPECFNNASCYAAPSSSNWIQYDNEIVMVRIDANNSPALIYRLALAHARQNGSGSDYFWSDPRAAVSYDGKYVIFDSNAAWAATGCGSVTNCTDLYLIQIH
jgi:hypothetical protein